MLVEHEKRFASLWSVVWEASRTTLASRSMYVCIADLLTYSQLSFCWWPSRISVSMVSFSWTRTNIHSRQRAWSLRPPAILDTSQTSVWPLRNQLITLHWWKYPAAWRGWHIKLNWSFVVKYENILLSEQHQKNFRDYRVGKYWAVTLSRWGTEPTSLFEKSMGRSPRCYVLACLHVVMAWVFNLGVRFVKHKGWFSLAT